MATAAKPTCQAVPQNLGLMKQLRHSWENANYAVAANEFLRPHERVPTNVSDSD